MIHIGVIFKAGTISGLLFLRPFFAMGDLPPGDPSIGGHGSTTVQSVAQSDDVCAAMDNALAAQALKGPVKRDANPQSTLPGMCAWRATSAPGDSLTVRVDEGGQDKYDFDRSKLPVRDLQGVGDKAFAFVSPAGFVQIGMMKGRIYVTIVLGLQNGSDRLQRATELARAIAARM